MTFRLSKITLILIFVFIMMLAFSVAVAAGSVLGDVDSDEEVTIIDATAIQRNLAGLPVRSFSKSAADIDGSGDIEITDATYIQRWLAGLGTSYLIGEPIQNATEAPTQKPTEAPTQRATDAEGWGRDIYQP